MANFADVYLNENAENCIKTYMVEERTMKILLERKGGVGSMARQTESIFWLVGTIQKIKKSEKFNKCLP